MAGTAKIAVDHSAQDKVLLMAQSKIQRIQGKKRRDIFLSALAQGCTVTSAAQAAGVARTTVYEWRADPDFETAWQAAEDAGVDILEQEAMRRACDGVEKPVYRGGEVVGHVTDYSDSMLMFLLKARRPEKFTDKKQAISPPTFDAGEIRDALQRKFALAHAGSKPTGISE